MNVPSIGIAVGTYGSSEWEQMGHDTLERTLSTQTAHIDAWSHTHAPTLSEARNGAAENCGDVDYLIFLDADDSLSERYCEKMRCQAIAKSYDLSKYYYWLVQPSTLGVYADGSEDDAPVLIPSKNIYTTNFLVIGTMCDAGLFQKVGGFRELAAIEDWDLWLRMIVRGAGITTCPEAVYRVGVNDTGRNQDTREHGRIYTRIRSEFKKHTELFRKVSLECE